MGESPCLKETRVTLRTVLASLADGDRVDEILADFPSLKAEDVQKPPLYLPPLPLKRTCRSPKFHTFDEISSWTIIFRSGLRRG